MTRFIAISIAMVLAGCKTVQPQDSISKATEEGGGGALASLTCEMQKNSSSSGELNLKKLRLSVRKPIAGQTVDLADVELEGTLKGSPVKFLRYCNNSYVMENPGTFVGSFVQVDLNYNKMIHWEMTSSGVPNYDDIAVAFALDSSGKPVPLQEGSLARVSGYKLDCKEGLDAAIPQMQCVSGFLPKNGPRSCAEDSSSLNSPFAEMCTSLGGKTIGCFGELNSMCDVNVRQKLILSGKFEGFD
ncbi:MAG: hypothetical protein NTV34_02760, partial [Proteobacteria bacterium]|nr:hypothetical protein [Pseudomonadota bacterium]